MQVISQNIIAIIGAVGGLSGIFTLFAYYRKVGKKYDLENEATEISSLKEIIKVLENSKTALEARVTALEQALGIKNAEIVKIETENNKRERAMSCQSLCETKPAKCPIILKYKELNK